MSPEAKVLLTVPPESVIAFFHPCSAETTESAPWILR